MPPRYQPAAFPPTPSPPHTRPASAVEFGLMSTTTDKSTAFAYSGVAQKRGTVLEITAGQVDVGASISVLSQYPGEEEFLMPPLSCLEVPALLLLSCPPPHSVPAFCPSHFNPPPDRDPPVAGRRRAARRSHGTRRGRPPSPPQSATIATPQIWLFADAGIVMCCIPCAGAGLRACG